MKYDSPKNDCVGGYSLPGLCWDGLVERRFTLQKTRYGHTDIRELLGGESGFDVG